MRAPIVCTSYRTEPLLTSSVPDLQFHFLAVYANGFDFEIDTYRSYVASCESVVGEPQKQWAFTYACNNSWG